jgi:malate synthase
VRGNISVALQYLAAWLGGSGAVAINNLMEDAATAEIARSQLWQWIRHQATTEDGKPITLERCRAMLREETAQLTAAGSDRDRLRTAGELLEGLFSARTFPEFLTLSAYEKL